MADFIVIYTVTFILIMTLSALSGVVKMMKPAGNRGVATAKMLIVIGTAGVMFGGVALYTAVVYLV